MVDPVKVSNFEDYKVLATLFEEGVAASVNDSEKRGHTFNFKLLKFSNVYGANQKFDIPNEFSFPHMIQISNGVVLDRSNPPDRLIATDLAKKFNGIEKKVILSYNNLFQDINDSSETAQKKFLRYFEETAKLQDELESKIIEAEEGRHYASVFNNIGQLKRLQYELVLRDGLELCPGSFNLEWFDKQELEVFSVLKQAIMLALPRSIKNQSWLSPAVIDDPNFKLQEDYIYKVSEPQAIVLGSAYCQLGAILFHRANRIEKLLKNSKFDQLSNELQRSLLSSEKKNLELMLSEFLFIAGIFGNKVARENAVGANPYAKLCGEIVKDSLISTFKCT